CRRAGFSPARLHRCSPPPCCSPPHATFGRRASALRQIRRSAPFRTNNRWLACVGLQKTTERERVVARPRPAPLSSQPCVISGLSMLVRWLHWLSNQQNGRTTCKRGKTPATIARPWFGVEESQQTSDRRALKRERSSESGGPIVGR